MKIVNTDYINDHEVELLGIVKGIGVEINNNDIEQGNLYAQLIEKAYNQALKKMISEASERKAEAIINVKVENEVSEGVIEVFIYGTAVRYKENYESQQF